MTGRSLFSRRPILRALLLFILGIFLALIFQIPYSIPLIILVATFFALTIAHYNDKTKASSWLTAFLLVVLGWYLTRVASGPFPPNHIESLAAVGGHVTLVGRVVDEPDIRAEKTYLVIEADSLYRNRVWIPTFGRLRAGIKDGGSRYQHADVVILDGYLYRPAGARNPQGFDYGAYLRNKEIFATIPVSGPDKAIILRKGNSFLSSVVSPLRSWLIAKTRENLPPLSAAILSGFILGEQRDIPKEYQDLFRNTGTLHLMAVSGSNVGVVLAIFAFPLTLLRIPRPPKVVILILVIVFFAVLTRLQPSVVRASIMATVGLIAYGWMRKPDYINLLALAGLLMLLWHPLQLFDVGLQLSFAATFGIIYTLPKINRWLSFLSGRMGRWLRGFLALLVSTITAQLAVLPLMAHYFQNVPVSGVLANIPMIMLAGFSTTLGIAFYFSPIIGGWPAHLISIPLNWLLNLVVITLRFFASLPYANIKVASPDWAEMILFWIVLYFAFELIADRRVSKLGIVAILLTSNILIWNSVFRPNADWRLEFLDLGRNHAWVFSGRDQSAIACYDCYVAQDDVDYVLTAHLLNRYRGALDYIFTTTPDSGGVLELASIFGSKIFSFPANENNLSSTNLTHFTGDGYAIDSNFPARVKVIWGKSDNKEGCGEVSPALRIDVKEGSIVLASWSGAEVLNGFCEKQLSLLELPWSNYARSACLNAIKQADPDLVVFSPDRYSRSLPRRREELTHSAERILAASICGGFAVSGVDGDIRIETMKPFTSVRK
jgi:ComEC/Rec2-related protein